MNLAILGMLLLTATAATAADLQPASDNGERAYLQNIKQLTSEGVNGEGYFSRDMENIIFQSIRGDNPYYQIYSMGTDGSNQRLISTGKGKTTCSYFRPDGKKIIYASTHHNPLSGTEPPPADRKYQWDFDTDMEIYEADPDGSDWGRLKKGEGERQVTNIDAVNWAPYFHPSGKYIIYASNPDGHGKFDLYIIKPDGTGLKRITFDEGFDGLPVFSPDGKRLLWTSTRVEGKSQLFIADWIYEQVNAP